MVKGKRYFEGTSKGGVGRASFAVPGKFTKKGVRKNGVPAKVEEAKTNPFERLQHGSKHQIIGRRLKGTQQDLGQARSRAIEKRKQSLLVELNQVCHQHNSPCLSVLLSCCVVWDCSVIGHATLLLIALRPSVTLALPLCQSFPSHLLLVLSPYFLHAMVFITLCFVCLALFCCILSPSAISAFARWTNISFSHVSA